MIQGCDVSYSNGLPNWDSAVATGRVQFVFNRACYGTNPADDDGESFVHNHDELKRLGVPFGTYQFYLFGQDGAAQAQHLIEAASGRYGTLFPVVDVEEESAAEGDGGSVAERIANLAAYSAAIEKALGCKPILYTNADTWSTYFGDTDGFAGHILWVASWGDPGEYAMPGGFKDAQIQQHRQRCAPRLQWCGGPRRSARRHHHCGPDAVNCGDELEVILALGIALLMIALAVAYTKRGRRKRPVALVLALPIIIKQGVVMANLEIPINSTEYVPIQTKDADGNVVAPPSGDTFTAVSSDPSIVASIGTMPSGPLSGQVCAVLVTSANEATNVTVTVNDADGLQAAAQVCDVVAGAPASIFLDAGDAVNVPNTPGAQKPA